MNMYSLPPLDPRLALIASMVEQGSVCADIGTDHGYLPVYLVKSGRCPKAFACDINAKPLQKAHALIASNGVSSRIETLLTDGLKGLEDKQPDTIILAGMGGELIASILEEAPFIRSEKIRLLLQPMTRPEHLREYLSTHGFDIVEEHGVVSGRFIYSVIHARYTGICRQPSPAFCLTGGLPKSSHPESAKCIEKTLHMVRQQIIGLEKARKQDLKEQILLRKELVQQLEALLEEQHERTANL